MTSADLWMMEHRQRERELAARAEHLRRARGDEVGRAPAVVPVQPVAAGPRRGVDGRAPRAGWAWDALARLTARGRDPKRAPRAQQGSDEPLCC